MKTFNKDTSSKKKEINHLLFVGIAFVILVVISVLLFTKCYGSYMDKLLYSERLKQMEEVTGQLFNGLSDVIDTEWNQAEVYCNYLELGKPKTFEELEIFIGKEAKLNNLKGKSTDIVGVDDEGRYYTQDGTQGFLNQMDQLMDAPEQVSFVSKTLTTGKSKMYFLYRLKEPVVLQSDSKNIRLIYYGLARDMEELNPYFSCDAYEGNNAVYVLNDDGEKLFNGNNSGMLDGYNVKTVLKNMEYLHGTTYEDAERELDSKGKTYSNVILNQEEYYYSLYQLPNSHWTMLFIVPSKYVAMNTVHMMNTTICVVLIFAIVLVVVCVCMVTFMLQLKQRQVLAVERKNNEQLAALNDKLELAVREADDANKAKTDFLANMSHDIRTPMNAIVGISSLMEHENGLSDKMETYIQKMQMSSRHLLGLINDILDMSRIESNEVQLNVEEVSLAEQIGQIDSIIREQVNEHEQHFHIRSKDIVHEYLICDGVRLRQICLNLLSNAVKYTPIGGDVIFELAEIPCDVEEHAKFVYTVIDNGYGMSPEFLNHVFEPFTREENSMTNKVQGTGLGMAITKNIVDLMGGEIRVDSTVGKGSRFDVILTLPINKNIDYEIDINRVLIISDESRLLRNIEAGLSKTAVEIYAVSTEKEAVSWLMQNRTDVILLSECQQNNTLKETVSRLRSSSKNEVCIFNVDFASDEDVQKYLRESGIDGTVRRPFFLSNLIAALTKSQMNVDLKQKESSILTGMNFLCAEDNELNAEILKELLNMFGASCTIYSDGEKLVEAFASVKSGEYDAILMDVQMPNMNGLEATKEIRMGNTPLGKTIPIIAMTANAFSEDVQHCISAGMDAHIAKPLDMHILEKTLRDLISEGDRTKSKLR